MDWTKLGSWEAPSRIHDLDSSLPGGGSGGDHPALTLGQRPLNLGEGLLASGLRAWGGPSSLHCLVGGGGGGGLPGKGLRQTEEGSWPAATENKKERKHVAGLYQLRAHSSGG